MRRRREKNNTETAFAQVGGLATSLFLSISFMLCVGLSLAFPAHQMSAALQMWLPGFTGLTPPSILLGLGESFAYGWLVAILWVPLYRSFAK